MQDYDQLLLDAVQLARQAGQIQLSYFRSHHLGATTKGGNDFDIVTQADKASEAAVVAGIKARYPDHSILTEESGLDREPGPWQWVIDPVDGTTNFNAGIPFFNVSIGVQCQGETVVGVVYAAALDELFTAVRGQGARLNGQPIHCSACQRLSEAVVSTGFPYDKATVGPEDNNLANVQRVMPLVRGLRRLGSAALDISYVAAGFLDGYWELNLHEWDVCAGSLIAAEAGAVVRRFRPDRGVSLLVAAPAVAKELLHLIG